ADGYPDHKPDGHVSVQELFNFVSARVDDWARRNRSGSRQTPQLYGEGNTEAFNLVIFKHGQQPEPRELADLPPYPAWLRDAWQVRARWWQNESYRLQPQAFRQLEATLLRAEQSWRGGANEAKLQKELGSLSEPTRPTETAVPPYSLALAAAGGEKPDAKTIE